MSPRTPIRFGARFLGALTATVAVVVGLPALLVAASIQRFDHVSPLHGLDAPWRWSLDDLRSWGRGLTHGLESSAQLVDLFFRLALIVGWVCVAIVVYTVVDEIAFPSASWNAVGAPSSSHRARVSRAQLGVCARRRAAAGRQHRAAVGCRAQRSARSERGTEFRRRRSISSGHSRHGGTGSNDGCPRSGRRLVVDRGAARRLGVVHRRARR